VHAAWAPDGRRIAFFRSAALQPTTLVVLDTVGGKSRTYALTMTNLGRPMWHPGGERIALHEETGRVGVFELDLRTGDIKQILGATNAYEYSPDGEHIVYRRTASGGRPNSIVQRHLITGEEHVMYVGPGGFDLASDGKSFLLYTRNNSSLWMAPVGGPARLVIAGIKAPDHHFALSDDGRFAYFSTSDPWEVWRVSTEGGTPEPLGFNVACIERLTLSPDGRSVTVNGGCASGQAVMWRVAS
jgi:Tol biopolymer transport system component